MSLDVYFFACFSGVIFYFVLISSRVRTDKASKFLSFVIYSYVLRWFYFLSGDKVILCVYSDRDVLIWSNNNNNNNNNNEICIAPLGHDFKGVEIQNSLRYDEFLNQTTKV